MAPANASLSEAAAALVKAAQLDVASTAQNKQLEASLEALKNSFDSKINSIQQVIQNSEKNFNDKINTLNQSVVNIINENVKEVKNEIAILRKMQSLEWAIQNVAVGSFQYYSESGHPINSSTIVLPVLCSFRTGLGHYMENGQMYHYFNRSQLSERKESQAAFRTKFATYIHTLTGVKPRLVLEADGRYTIFYS
jgi:RNA polymerase-binding transcription factor DksA